MIKHTVLIIDPDENLKEDISSFFEGDEISFSQSMTAEEGLNFMGRNRVSLLIVSSDVEGMKMETFLRRTLLASPQTVRMVITDMEGISSLDDEIYKGTIFHFITRPLKGEVVVRAIRSGLSYFEEGSFSERRSFVDQARSIKKLKEEVGESGAFEVELKDMASRLGKGWIKTVKNLARVMESRVPYLTGHADEVALVASEIANDMDLPEDLRSDIEIASYIQDVGMIFINDDAFRRAGPLKDSELASVRKHPFIAEELLGLGLNRERVKTFIREHHERFDGKGYPGGVAGDKISIGGRILAAADFVASARHNRSYRNAMTEKMILDHLKEMSGKEFDPGIAALLINRLEKKGWSSVREEHGKKKTEPVLIVDDEVNILKSLKRLLERKGYSSIIIEKPEDALDVLGKEEISLIISDHRMPGMTGVEFLQKARELVPDVPRVLLTGYADKRSAIDAINKGGIYRYLEKPWDDEEVIAVIESAIIQRDARKRMEEMAFSTVYDDTSSDKKNDLLKADLITALETLAEKENTVKKLMRAKDDFLGIASHELRTPLQLIISGVELLKEETDPELQKRFLNILDAGTQRMTRIVGEIFAVAAEGRGIKAVEAGLFSVREMLEDISEEMTPFVEKRSQSLTVSIPDDLPPLWGDSSMLRDAIMNLTSNAIRFSPDGGSIELSVDKREGEQVIAVSDSGIGIPEDEKDKIFENFYVVEEAKRHGAWDMDFMAGSIGLGLSIVKAAAERHGGRVEVESPRIERETGKSEKGSVFRIIIPAMGPMK